MPDAEQPTVYKKADAKTKPTTMGEFSESQLDRPRSTAIPKGDQSSAKASGEGHTKSREKH